MGDSGREVSKSAPCPICSKHDWCYCLDDGIAVNCKRLDQAPEGWRVVSSAKEGHIFRPIEVGWKKDIRPKQQRSWSYQDVDGCDIITVYRTDDGQGNKRIRQKSLIQGKKPKQLQAQVMPYRYAECLEEARQGQLIFWVEGEPCADALWAIGIPATTTIRGSGAYSSEQYAKVFPKGSVVICPDRDGPGLKYADAIAQDYPEAQWCYAFPDSLLWNNVRGTSGADVADWIESGATVNDIHGAVGPRRNHEVQSQSRKSKSSEQPKENRLKRSFHAVETLLSQRLAYNEYTKQIELDSEPIEISRLKLRLAVESNLLIGLDDLELIMRDLAERKSYHPVRDYLENCGRIPPLPNLLDTLSQRYFGTSDTIYDAYLKRTLIGAVARVFEPGCKFDNALILQGSQGIGKSTFFKILAGGDEFFDDSLGATSEKDERLKLHQSWFLEWAELESVFRRKDIAATKAFITSSVDNVRPPYGRQAVRMARQSIIVGSTNQDAFLSDATGNRRFWVIPVQGTIDLELLRAERDQIWAAAVAAYRAGENAFLSADERIQAANAVRDYQASDPWESRILEYIHHHRLDAVTTTEILTSALQMEVQHQEKRHQMRAADFLRGMGWERKRITRHGRQQMAYLKPTDTEDTSPAEPLTTDSNSETPDMPTPEKSEAPGAMPLTTAPPLSTKHLTDFMRWNLDEPDRYQQELAKLTSAQVEYLYRQLPELRPLAEVVSHV